MWQWNFLNQTCLGCRSWGIHTLSCTPLDVMCPECLHALGGVLLSFLILSVHWAFPLSHPGLGSFHTHVVGVLLVLSGDCRAGLCILYGDRWGSCSWVVRARCWACSVCGLADLPTASECLVVGFSEASKLRLERSALWGQHYNTIGWDNSSSLCQCPFIDVNDRVQCPGPQEARVPSGCEPAGWVSTAPWAEQGVRAVNKLLGW